MRLLALDLGFQTGYAVVEPGKPPITGSRSIPGSAADLGITCHAVGHLVRDLIEEHKPDGLVLCTPYISTKFQDINPTLILFGMFGMAAAVAHSMHVVLYRLYEPTVRAAFGVKVPKGTPKKKRHDALKGAVVLACSSRRWLVTDHHAGDAMLAGAYQLGVLLTAVPQQISLPLPKTRRKKAA